MASAKSEPKVAIIHDWLVTRGGSERVLEALLPLFPEAPIFTLVYNPEVFQASPISGRNIQASYVDKLPFSHTRHRWYLSFMTHAVRQFDLSDFDVIISISHAVAHGVRSLPDQLHINYILTPARYAWQQRAEYAALWGVPARLAQGFLAYFRNWDRRVIKGVDQFIAISEWIDENVRLAYDREVDAVIYPPVETTKFKPALERQDYYIVVSRLVPYKRIDLIVKAFNQLGLQLLIIGEGPEKDRLLRIANNNVRFLGYQNDVDKRQLLAQAKAFVYASREDFGIAPVEAQAAGCPVIAFRGGALSETVLDGATGILTGILYEEQTVKSLVEAVERFEANSEVFSSQRIARHAAQFSQERFQQEFSTFFSSAWKDHLEKTK